MSTTERRDGRAPDQLREIAVHIVETVLSREPVPVERPQGFDDIRRAFAPRAGATEWSVSAEGENAFDGSLAALVEWAPVADELKILDVDIVRFSMRFRWKTVRDEIKACLEGDAVLTNWRD